MACGDIIAHKTRPLCYEDLLTEILVKIGYPEKRHPLLIAVEGRCGAGKSSLASWLSWQLGAPAVHLDLFLTGKRLEWREDDLARLFAHRLETGPLIVEGVFVLNLLQNINRSADFIIFVENQINAAPELWKGKFRNYCEKHGLPEDADYQLFWSEPRAQSMEEARAALKARVIASVKSGKS